MSTTKKAIALVGGVVAVAVLSSALTLHLIVRAITNSIEE